MQSRTLFKLFFLCFVACTVGFILLHINALPISISSLAPKNSEEIKWVDFDVSHAALKKAMNIDIDTYNSEELHIDWIDVLAYLGAKYGGDFSKYKAKDMDVFCSALQNGETIESMTSKLKYFPYYRRAYGAVLSGFIGDYKVQVPIDDSGTVMWQDHYGLKVFSPIAEGYWYSDSDDFGASRSYGYDRKHFGHDLMVSTGTPVIAIESGIVEIVGWNQYGGWRIGIRSFDKQRYYYYAHLRKNHPYNDKLYQGMAVNAGDVIGYSGQTGYSIKENVNNIDTPHLHVGMQLIFDESEKDSPNQIWIDMYAITQLLSDHRSAVYKNEDRKEYYRKYLFSEPSYYLASASPNTVQSDIPIPIIMYHGLIKDKKLQTEYFISPDEFEKDLKHLKKNGYTTILMRDLIDYVEKGAPLPEKPILLTFDDGYYNNYLYAYPLLREYEMKAVISIIGTHTDKFSLTSDNHAAYSHLTWEQINEMLHSGIVEIQNHTYDMHTYDQGRSGTKKNYSETISVYKDVLNDDIGFLQNRITEMTNCTPTTFAYPFGFVSTDSTEILKEMGFKASLGCEEGINYITKDPECLFLMKRCLRSGDISMERILSKF